MRYIAGIVLVLVVMFAVAICRAKAEQACIESILPGGVKVLNCSGDIGQFAREYHDAARGKTPTTVPSWRSEPTVPFIIVQPPRR